MENLEPVGVFDPRAVFPLKDSRIRKSCDLRFPTDAEWRERSRKICFVTTPSGHDRSRTEETGEDAANLALFQSIRQDQGEPFDESEASRMIESITRCTVLESGLVDDRFAVRLLLFSRMEVVHLVKIPSAKQERTYRREVLNRETVGRHGRVESRINPAAGEKLYDALEPEARGYAEGASVPLLHKTTVIGELMQALEELEAADPFATATPAP